ncbi:S8 family serine peptidase [Micromonospora sp. NPDC050200]|uniref:S8 family peptidase n=1 Tax=Micromonospora sp. NPDC050200 TaxID=3155664 RepID=UPI0033DA507A
MTLSPRNRRALAASAVLAAVAGVTTLVAPPASATPAEPAASAPAAAAAHFVVLGPQGGSLTTTEASVKQAGGQVVQSWPQIGVVIAKSSKADFAAAVRTMPGIAGAGASRNLAELAPGGGAAAAGSTSLEKVEGAMSAADVKAAATAATAAAEEPLAAYQWDMRMIKSDKAHAISTGSRDVLVGVLDVGVDATHPDLAPNIDPVNSVGCTNSGVPDTSPAAWVPTGLSHGTHVAGTIAAARNGVGIVGVAPNVRIASIKVGDDSGKIYPEYAICGFVWAAEHGMEVTNSSYFVDPWYRWCNDDADQRAAAEGVRRAIDYSARKDVVNVAALGNSNWDLAHTIIDENSPNNGDGHDPITPRVTTEACTTVPAEVPGVVGVSSVGAKALKSHFSNYGVGDTDVTAPGGASFQHPDTPDMPGSVLSTLAGGGWGFMMGTSMASPHVAGVLALIRSTHPDWSAQQTIAALQRDADPLPCPPGIYDPGGWGIYKAECQGGPAGTGFYGSGLVDALDAVR